MTRFQPDYVNTICAGPAHVRLIEAVKVLMEWTLELASDDIATG
jgi:hypothetical protein